MIRLNTDDFTNTALIAYFFFFSFHAFLGTVFTFLTFKPGTSTSTISATFDMHLLFPCTHFCYISLFRSHSYNRTAQFLIHCQITATLSYPSVPCGLFH
jgi:hypothetical protein